MRPARRRGSGARAGHSRFICARLSHMLSAGLVSMRMRTLQVDLESGLLRGVRQIASPNCDSRPAGVEPELIVVHGISLPPGEFGGPWIDRLFTNALPPDAHPYFAEVAALQVSSHLASAGTARSTAVCELSAARLARRDNPATAAARPATIFRSAWNSKAPIRLPTRPCSIKSLAEVGRRPVRGLSQALARLAWSATATSRRGARPIPDRPSIGRSRAA